LQGISDKTIKKIGNALQTKKVSSRWADLDFWAGYFGLVSNSSSKAYKVTIKTLIQIIDSVRLEEQKQRDFELEFHKIMTEY
jgi:hypothetical protein